MRNLLFTIFSRPHRGALAIAAIFCLSFQAAAQVTALSVIEKRKLSPFLQFTLTKDAATLQKLARVMSVSGTAPTPTVDVLIRTRPGVTRNELSLISKDIVLRTQAGNIFTAVIPIDLLPLFAKDERVVFISPIQKMQPKNDIAKSSDTDAGDYLGVAALTQGLSGYAGVKGDGVVVGIVDTGIDFRHPALMTADNKSRILYLWDQTISGTHPAGYDYGAEWTKAQLDQQLGYASCRSNIANCILIPQRDDSGHGTHVAGSAAGDHFLFEGMAPNADIIVVKTDFSHIVDGVNYIFQKAAALGKAAVVNLSLGGHVGAHDGTDDQDVALDNLVGPGKIIVAAAGNERIDNLHGSATIAATHTFNLTVRSAVSQALLNLWHDGLDQYTVSVKVNNGTAISATHGNQTQGNSSGALVILSNSEGGPNPGNNDNNVWIYIDGDLSPGWPITVTYTFTGGSGDKRVDGWCSQDGADLQFDSPDVSMLVGSPGTATQAITVGAYVTRNAWQSTEPNSYCINYPGGDTGTYPCAQMWPLGTMAWFSSPGPTRDGRLKPEITAPGDKIISALSQSASPAPDAKYKVYDGAHQLMQGTSMATPLVTGIVALHLQQNPSLTPAQMKTILSGHARKDDQTEAYGGSPTPNNDWGYGKILGTPPAWPAPASLIGTATSTVKIGWRYTRTAQNQLGIRVQDAVSQAIYGDLLPDTTTFDLINLSTNTQYSLRVSVFNDAGASTSAATSVYTLSAPPTSPGLTSVWISSASATWGGNQNPAGTIFTLENSVNNFTSISASSRTIASTATISSLLPNTSYYFRVKAENGDAITTAYTQILSSVSLAAAPSGISLTQLSSTSLHIAWQANSNPADTQYELSLSSTNFTAAISTPMPFSVNSVVTEKDATELLLSTTYYVRVRAKNRMGILTGFASTSMFLPPSLTQSVPPSQTVSMVFSNAALTIPSQSFPETVVVTLQSPASFPASNSFATTLTGVNSGIDITTDKNLVPQKGLTLTLTYTSAQAAGLDESRFVVARYEPVREVWIPYASTPDPAANQVTALIDHLSLFQVMMGTPASSLSSAAIKVFPNPVRPSRGQTLKISGLPAGTAVKIYTFQGELVRELTADGAGIVQWDVKNSASQIVASEVYLALIKSGGDTKTVKVMVER